MLRRYVFYAALLAAWLPAHEALAVCHLRDVSRVAVIKKWGGSRTKELLKIYSREGQSCYIGNGGSSFGPFQLHYGGTHNTRGNRLNGMGNIFTRQTGLDARNESTVPAQVRFMKRWGEMHGGYSSNIWHGLRCHHCKPQAFWRHERMRHHRRRYHWILVAP